MNIPTIDNHTRRQQKQLPLLLVALLPRRHPYLSFNIIRLLLKLNMGSRFLLLDCRKRGVECDLVNRNRNGQWKCFPWWKMQHHADVPSSALIFIWALHKSIMSGTTLFNFDQSRRYPIMWSFCDGSETPAGLVQPGSSQLQKEYLIATPESFPLSSTIRRCHDY